MQSIIKGGLAGGIVLFVWEAISWMGLPWHTATLHTFSQEKVVEVVLSANAPKAGVYMLPNPHVAGLTPEARKAAKEKARKGPFVFVVMNPKGWGPIRPHLLIGLLTQIAGAALVTGFLLIGKGKKSYGEKVGLVVLFALAAAVVCHIPFWNWWGFSVEFTLLSIADLLIGWFLAGLVIAKIT